MVGARPFHEVVGERLYKAHMQLVESEYTTKWEVMGMLAILMESQMPAEAAHAIAERNADLRRLAGKSDTGFFERVDSALTNLATRT
ncbi:MAG: hypothetical protein JWN89_386 [Parcubacteria group bacterium]|nr:hypothetical protein [Parcubacteria group bacterium]